MTSGQIGAEFFSELNKPRVELIVEYVDEIVGMLYFMGNNSNVFDIRSALVLGMYASCNFECPMAGPMHQPVFPCNAHDTLYFGLL